MLRGDKRQANIDHAEGVTILTRAVEAPFPARLPYRWKRSSVFVFSDGPILTGRGKVLLNLRHLEGIEKNPIE